MLLTRVGMSACLITSFLSRTTVSSEDVSSPLTSMSVNQPSQERNGSRIFSSSMKSSRLSTSSPVPLTSTTIAMKAKFLKRKSILAMFDHPRVSDDVDESWNERLFDHVVPLPHYRPPVEKGKDKKEKESHSQTV